MQIIPLQAIPNQQFSVVLGDNQWDIVLKTADNITVADVTLNNVVIMTGFRCVAGMRIIPSLYQEAGNFFFSTQRGQLPDYTQFGLTQFLLYYTAAELAALRVPPGPIITVADFDPLGQLPLRFKPQGYILVENYITEDDDDDYVTEDGSEFYVTEGSQG